MPKGVWPRLNAAERADNIIGVTTACLRKMGGTPHGFPQSGSYTITWHNSRTRQVITSMACQITPAAAVFSYSLAGDQVTLSIPFTWTACNYGGTRTWFKCQCGQRASKVFFRGEHWGCRLCLGLTYQTRFDCQINRAWGHIYKIWWRLKRDGPLPLVFLKPPRPKGMHWRRYRMLCKKLEWAYARKDMAIVKELAPGGLKEPTKDR